MEVSFFVPNYAPSVGGAQSHVQHVAEGLVARHAHRVSIVTTDTVLPPAARNPGHIDEPDGWINGVWVRRLPVARRIHDALRFGRRVGRRLGRTDPASASLLSHGPAGVRWARAMLDAGRRSDVVVGVAAPFTTLLGADLVTRRTDAALVTMPLLHLSDGPPQDWVLRSLRRAHGCSVNTGFERDWLVEHGLSPERVVVLPPGCRPEHYSELEPSRARLAVGLPPLPTVGYLGRLAAHKGIDTLLEAMQRVWSTRPQVQLLVAGAPTKWDLQAALDRLPVEHRDRIVLRTDVSDDEKATLLAACDVVAFPSRSESFGMVTVEAWCARRPVVAGDIDSVRSLIRPGEDGELVPVDAPEALADALDALLDDPERRRTYGVAGRHRAESEFAWDGIVDGWQKLLVASVGRRLDGDPAMALSTPVGRDATGGS